MVCLPQIPVDNVFRRVLPGAPIICTCNRWVTGWVQGESSPLCLYSEDDIPGKRCYTYPHVTVTEAHMEI